MKTLLLIIFATFIFHADTSAQFKKTATSEIVGRFNNRSIVISKRSNMNVDGEAIYYLSLADASLHNIVYLPSVKLGNKKQALEFFNNMLAGWSEMKSGDEFSDLGLPDGQKGGCGSSAFGEKYFYIICDNLGNFGWIYKFSIKSIISSIENDK